MVIPFPFDFEIFSPFSSKNNSYANPDGLVFPINLIIFEDKIALSIKEPRANFILKRLIFDESPKTLTKEDFKMVHRELHERLVINQERPFTTIPEAMTQTDTELVKMEDSDDEHKAQKMQILKDYNVYLNFMEKYFSNKNAEPLPSGKKLSKIIFG